MSKVFDAIRQAELDATERKQAKASEARTAEAPGAQTGNSAAVQSGPQLVPQSPSSHAPAPNPVVQTSNSDAPREEVTLMSKVFDALKQAELDSDKRKQAAAAAARVTQETRTKSDGPVSAQDTAQSVAARHTANNAPSPSTTAESSKAKVFSLQPGMFHPDAKPSGAAKARTGVPGMMAGLISRAWPGRKTRAEVRTSTFGELGMSLESAGKSPFWQWFHLEQTREENGVHRFQPNGSEFRSLCYLDVTVSAKNEMRTLTLGAQRVFVNGEGEPFARDLVRSFLCVLFPAEKAEAISRFVDELGTDYGGSRGAIAEGKRGPVPLGAPSPLYLVFLGQGKRCAMELGALQLEEENVTEGSTRWLCLRVGPAPTGKKKRAKKSAS